MITMARDRNVLPLLLSPNSVLANALLRSIDLLRPRVHARRPDRIIFCVGTQINGAPHLGTNLVQAAAFLLAKAARREFSIDTSVQFAALDNAPYDVVLDPETHHAYQQTYVHALGKAGVADLIDQYYRVFFRSLSDATDTEFTVETYTDQQAAPGFRAEFLRSLERLEDVRWWLAPSHGVVHVRLPCARCGWAEKRGDRTKLVSLDEAGAVFTAVCLDHGSYAAHVDPADDEPYLDLATLYRNLIKERVLGRDPSSLHIMMKGATGLSAASWWTARWVRWRPRQHSCRFGSSRRRCSRRQGRSCPSHCCANTGRACCRLMSSRGCSIPPPGPAMWTTTLTFWCGWSPSCSPTRSTSSARSP